MEGGESRTMARKAPGPAQHWVVKRIFHAVNPEALSHVFALSGLRRCIPVAVSSTDLAHASIALIITPGEQAAAARPGRLFSLSLCVCALFAPSRIEVVGQTLNTHCGFSADISRAFSHPPVELS
jgi:hypothetical protein